jgi:hypothetical protein
MKVLYGAIPDYLLYIKEKPLVNKEVKKTKKTNKAK